MSRIRLVALIVPPVAPMTLGGSDMEPAGGLVDATGGARGPDESLDEHGVHEAERDVRSVTDYQTHLDHRSRFIRARAGMSLRL